MHIKLSLSAYTHMIQKWSKCLEANVCNLFCLLILHSAKTVFPFSIKLVPQQLSCPTANLRSSMAQPKQLIKKQLCHSFSKIAYTDINITLLLKINIVAAFPSFSLQIMVKIISKWLELAQKFFKWCIWRS